MIFCEILKFFITNVGGLSCTIFGFNKLRENPPLTGPLSSTPPPSVQHKMAAPFQPPKSLSSTQPSVQHQNPLSLTHSSVFDVELTFFYVELRGTRH